MYIASTSGTHATSTLSWCHCTGTVDLPRTCAAPGPAHGLARQHAMLPHAAPPRTAQATAAKSPQQPLLCRRTCRTNALAGYPGRCSLCSTTTRPPQAHFRCPFLLQPCRLLAPRRAHRKQGVAGHAIGHNAVAVPARGHCVRVVREHSQKVHLVLRRQRLAAEEQHVIVPKGILPEQGCATSLCIGRGVHCLEEAAAVARTPPRDYLASRRSAPVAAPFRRLTAPASDQRQRLPRRTCRAAG